MAYTAEDLQRVRQAILALASGERVTSVTRDGRTVQYAVADLDKLRALESEIVGALGPARRSRTRLTVTTKGL